MILPLADRVDSNFQVESQKWLIDAFNAKAWRIRNDAGPPCRAIILEMGLFGAIFLHTQFF
jgi:hypothetical protein